MSPPRRGVSGASYLYEFGHANGIATVIRALGKVPRTFAEVAYARYFEDNPGLRPAVRPVTPGSGPAGHLNRPRTARLSVRRVGRRRL
ncbi:hypothetical protein [Kribbella sp. NPDC004536]|uniref:hypothetical protein n=1 Tax=Kribbella sp. NPDC004536 TaxID=3364106 RepID=UPI0036737CBC